MTLYVGSCNIQNRNGSGAKKKAEDRGKRRHTKGPPTDKGGGRERNVGHPNSEEHSRISKK